jgi:hypothetical protein
VVPRARLKPKQWSSGKWKAAKGRGASKKKEKENKHEKKNLAKSDRPFFFFFFQVPLLSAMRVGCGHATADRRWAPAAGCGVFLSDNKLIPGFQ